ncbi:MAG TPA: hypothetical protein VF185_01230 [Patescibacteria group bacterium]
MAEEKKKDSGATGFLNKYWWVLLGGCGCIVVIPFVIAFVVGVLLVAVNPAAQINKAKDARRSNDQVHVQTALESYYIDKSVYPTSLDELVPYYMALVPVETDSQVAPYKYTVLDKGINYQFCVTYSSGEFKCVDSKSVIGR